MNGTDPLADLRPLHAPPPIAWWPPAPGWWLLLAAVLVLALVGVWWWRRNALQRAALRELKGMSALQEQPVKLAAAVNRLLKRYALICWPAHEVAALSGQAWLDFLDSKGGRDDFSSGSGQILLNLPYASSTDSAGSPIEAHAEALIPLARRWIKRNRPGSRC